MRIGLVSDLHEDHWLLKTGRSAIDAIEGGVCDVLVVAGDLFQYSHDRNMAITKLRNLRDKAPEVIYVPGNHEYYDMHFMEAQQALESAHFLPSYMSVHHQYADDPFNCLFVTQGAEEIMREKQPRLWLHGHTHTPCDYRQYNTRVVCKPLGYPTRPNQKARKMPFVIDTEAGDSK